MASAVDDSSINIVVVIIIIIIIEVIQMSYVFIIVSYIGLVLLRYAGSLC